jgi:hypothetical protein
MVCQNQTTTATVATVRATVTDETDSAENLTVQGVAAVGSQERPLSLRPAGGEYVGTFSIDWEESLSNGGEVLITVEARDATGNTTTTELPLTLDACFPLPPADTVPPVIRSVIVEPELLAQVPPSGQFCFGGESGDQVAEVVAFISDETDDDIRVFVSWQFSSTSSSIEVPHAGDGGYVREFSLSWRSGWDAGGPITITISAFDAAGNSDQVVRTIQLDRCTPDFVIR